MVDLGSIKTICGREELIPQVFGDQSAPLSSVFAGTFTAAHRG
jgi:hypothetical protein